MKIVSITTQLVRIPLPAKVGFSIKSFTHRDHLLVRVQSDEGVEGVGFCLQDHSGRAAKATVDDLLSPLVLGQDPRDIRRIWEQMYWQTVRAGRRGNLLHALSAVDIALWDHMGKLCNQPLHKLLGGYRDEVPCYASGGYYYDGQNPLRALENEVAQYMEMGFKAVKMKVGRLSLAEEVERVRLVRELVGPDVRLMIDANQAYLDVNECMELVRRIAGFDIFWFEEPLPVDMIEAMARLRARSPISLATGEVEATRWAFQELIRAGAVDFIQPDATVAGGITEWLQIAALAGAQGVSVAPHYHWDVHVHLACAVPQVVMLEKFVGTSVKNFDLILAEPLTVTPRGTLRPPAGPGLGMPLDEEAVRRFTVEETVKEV